MDEQAPIYITKMEVIIFLPKNIYILLTASLAKVETVLWSKRKNTPIIQHAPETRWWQSNRWLCASKMKHSSTALLSLLSIKPFGFLKWSHQPNNSWWLLALQPARCSSCIFVTSQTVTITTTVSWSSLALLPASNSSHIVMFCDLTNCNHHNNG